MLRKPCRLQTDGQTDGRTDRRTDKVNPVYPPPTSLGGGINIKKNKVLLQQMLYSNYLATQFPIFHLRMCAQQVSNQLLVCELGDTDLVTGLYEDFMLGPLTHNSINRTLSDKLPISRSCNNSIGLTVMLFINLTETTMWGWKSKLSVPHPWQKINSEPESRSALCLAKKYDSGSCHFMAFPGSQERPWSDMTHFWVAWFHNWLIWLVGWLTHWLTDWRINCLIT